MTTWGAIRSRNLNSQQPPALLPVRCRALPLASSPSSRPPIATLISLSTSISKAPSRRRIWRLRPSSSTISSQAVRPPLRSSSIELAVNSLAADDRSVAKPLQHRLVRHGADLHMIGLGDMRGRIEQAVEPSACRWSSKAGLRWPCRGSEPATRKAGRARSRQS